jgi:hypothetical protein
LIGWEEKITDPNSVQEVALRIYRTRKCNFLFRGCTLATNKVLGKTRLGNAAEIGVNGAARIVEGLVDFVLRPHAWLSNDES